MIAQCPSSYSASHWWVRAILCSDWLMTAVTLPERRKRCQEAGSDLVTRAHSRIENISSDNVVKIITNPGKNGFMK